VTFGSPTPSAARVILDVRPDGNIEFMSRLADDVAMSYIGGATVAFPVWLRLVRAADQVTGSISSDGSAWTVIGSVNVALPASVAGGLAVTSHDASQLNTATFDNVTLVADGSSPPNLLQDPGFESSAPPSFASPGWTSDTNRQTPAQSETSEPHSGAMNGACRTTSALDCGIYQDVVAPADGHYTFTVYANASRAGAWIGVNVNNAGVQSAPVEVRGAGSYGTPYSLTFTAMPATPSGSGCTRRTWRAQR
jgi:hypothetical protein